MSNLITIRGLFTEIDDILLKIYLKQSYVLPGKGKLQELAELIMQEDTNLADKIKYHHIFWAIKDLLTAIGWHVSELNKIDYDKKEVFISRYLILNNVVGKQEESIYPILVSNEWEFYKDKSLTDLKEGFYKASEYLKYDVYIEDIKVVDVVDKVKRWRERTTIDRLSWLGMALKPKYEVGTFEEYVTRFCIEDVEKNNPISCGQRSVSENLTDIHSPKTLESLINNAAIYMQLVNHLVSKRVILKQGDDLTWIAKKCELVPFFELLYSKGLIKRVITNDKIMTEIAKNTFYQFSVTDRALRNKNYGKYIEKYEQILAEFILKLPKLPRKTSQTS